MDSPFDDKLSELDATARILLDEARRQIAVLKASQTAQCEAIKKFFDDQIATAQAARKMYQDGAAERTGIERESYLAYADAQATRETFLREVFSAFSFLLQHSE